MAMGTTNRALRRQQGSRCHRALKGDRTLVRRKQLEKPMRRSRRTTTSSRASAAGTARRSWRPAT